ncbi:MAG: DUF2480 family protein [Rhodothermia bacterium]
MDFEPIINKVAKSDLIVFDLEDVWDGHEIASFDLAPLLFKGLILKEKDFRLAMKDLEASRFADKHVAVFCSTNAIIPTWAFMAVAAKLAPVAASVGYGTPEDVIRDRISVRLDRHDWSRYAGQNVIIKGCPSDIIPISAYVDAVSALQEVAAKIMYGEACSSVPIWKKPQETTRQRKAIPVKLPPIS